MSRQTATVLFTDLVGSTELRGRLGEEAADELRRKHDRLLTEAVEAHNGRVVKGLGDGIMATFAGASDAVAAAVAIQQAVDRLNRSGTAPVPLAIGIGLSAGDVGFEHDDVHGRPVIEASRLCDAAAGNEILVCEVVLLLAGPPDSKCIPRGSLELKGLPNPVSVWEVRWEPAPASTIPMPVVLSGVGRIFVGRSPELERLTQLWNGAAAGERRVVLLAGEPGVGKTRLAAELAMRVHGAGGVVLAGRCDEDLGVPYQPFVEALRHFVDHTAPEELTERLGRYGGELVRLVPELADHVPALPPPLRSDPETERYRLFDAMAGWLTAVSAEDPLLVILDDLQWATKPTLLLLRHVVRASDARRLLIVGAYRDTELTRDHPLVELAAALHGDGRVDRLALSGLDDMAVAEIVEQLAGDVRDDKRVAVARAVYEETEGNPFFVREVLLHLDESGLIDRRDGVTSTPMPLGDVRIPEGVREVIGRRLSRLSPEANRVLRVAAVVGTDFDVSVLCAAAGVNAEMLVGVLEEAIGAGLVLEIPGPAGRHRFAHGLVRDALYGDLSAVRRAVLHGRVAEAIETVHGHRVIQHVPALAYHWARASVPGPRLDKAVTYATQAGDQALAQFANHEAVSYYRHALELLELLENQSDEPQRLTLLVALGEAERRAGDPNYRDTLLAAAAIARKRGDGPALAQAALANDRGFFSSTGRVDTERVQVLESALGGIGPDDSPARARLLANLASELVFAADHTRRHRLAAESVAMARRVGDLGTLAHVLSRQFTTVVPASTTECREVAAELSVVASELEDPAVDFWAHHWAAFTALSVGDAAALNRELGCCAQLAGELGQPFFRWVVGFVQSNCRRIAGLLEDAEALARQALEVGQAAGVPDSFRVYGVNLFWVRYDHGTLDTVVDVLERAAQRRPTDGLTLAALAAAQCELGRVNEARGILADLAGDGLVTLHFNWTWLYGMTLAAGVCASVGDADRAAGLYERLMPYQGFVAHSWAGATGTVSHYLALLAHVLGYSDEADAHFAAAESTSSRMGARAWLSRNRLEWGRMLLTRRRRGEIEQGRELVSQALATAGQLGLASIERRARELLQEAP